MLHKNPRPQLRKFIKKSATVLFVIEAFGFAGSYFLWYRLNTNRDFRQYCNTNYPSILDGYYKIGELFDTAGTIETIRKQDNTVWAAAAAKSSSKEL